MPELPADFTDIPGLLRWAKARRKAPSLNAMAMYIGVPPGTLHRWLSGMYKPDPESCEKIAAWAGLPLSSVLAAAGHLAVGAQLDDIPPPPEEIVIPELGLLLKRFTPDEQRRLILPTVRLVAELREEFEPAQPTPPTRPGLPRPPEDPASPPPDAPPA